MSGPMPPVPADEFVLPLPAAHDESTEPLRRSMDSSHSRTFSAKPSQGGQNPAWKIWRHTVGIALLLATVVMWTASNFLASTIFANDSYSKPYFVTYINSSFFSVLLIPVAVKRLWASGGSVQGAIHGQGRATRYQPLVEDENQDFMKPDDEDGTQPAGRSPRSRLMIEEPMTNSAITTDDVDRPLNIRETAWLSFEFCILWFLANYFTAACLEYTTVASATILSSTSGVWTLAFGTLLKVEKFSIRKLIGVLASLAGIMLISSIDVSGDQDKNRGSFPHKSHKQIAIGDILALASAVMYGIYTTVMKKKIGDESRADMFMFFGFVGVINIITLLPGFFVLHFTGIETFELPPTRRILVIVMANSLTSLVSDICWAYSMLLTSPLVTTVGLSLTIPLSLVGQMIEYSQNRGVLYWLGACMVVLAFVFINYESTHSNGENGDKEQISLPERIRDYWQKIQDRLKLLG